MSWTIAEDDILSNNIIDYLNRGASINDALLKTSKAINKTVSCCSDRWYEHLRKDFNNTIASIKRGIKRINEYVGPWSYFEDDRLTSIMINYQVNNLKIVDALDEASKRLNRSAKSCEDRWYNYILKRNRLTITNKISEGKSKMSQNAPKKGYNVVARNWKKSEEDMVVGIIISGLKKGESMQYVMERAAIKLNKKVSNIRGYWYAHLFPENKLNVEAARGTTTAGSVVVKKDDVWSEDKKYELYKFVMDEMNDSSNKGITSTLRKAAAKFSIEQNEAHTLWYSYLRNNDSYSKRYIEERKANAQKEKVESSNNGDTLRSFELVEDELILDVVSDAMRKHRPLLKAFSTVAQQLKRSVGEVELRWKKVLQYRYASQIQGIRDPKNAKQEVVKEENVQETSVEVVNEVAIIQNTAVDVTKITDFLVHIQSLVTENQNLKIEVENLKLEKQNQIDKDAKIAEQFEQIKKLTEILEQTRQILSFPTN